MSAEVGKSAAGIGIELVAGGGDQLSRCDRLARGMLQEPAVNPLQISSGSGSWRAARHRRHPLIMRRCLRLGAQSFQQLPDDRFTQEPDKFCIVFIDGGTP